MLTFKEFLIEEWINTSEPDYEEAMELLVDLGNDLIDGDRLYIGKLDFRNFQPNDRRLKPLVPKFIEKYKNYFPKGLEFGGEEDFVDARYELVYTFLRKYHSVIAEDEEVETENLPTPDISLYKRISPKGNEIVFTKERLQFGHIIRGKFTQAIKKNGVWHYFDSYSKKIKKFRPVLNTDKWLFDHVPVDGVLPYDTKTKTFGSEIEEKLKQIAGTNQATFNPQTEVIRQRSNIS